jgi:glycosyltransferase involved in cell wall biosynthesis
VAAHARWRDRFGHYVLAVGGIEPRKGTLDLVAAMARLHNPGTRPVVAGGETLFDKRPYRAEVDALVADLGVLVEVLGPVPQPELPSLVAAAGAFAFPSTKEGFGLAVMEAMAAGVPVVTRDLPVLREVFGSAAPFATDIDGLAAGLDAALAAPDPARAAAGRALAASYSGTPQPPPTWPCTARAEASSQGVCPLHRSHGPAGAAAKGRKRAVSFKPPGRL